MLEKNKFNKCEWDPSTDNILVYDEYQWGCMQPYEEYDPSKPWSRGLWEMYNLHTICEEEDSIKRITLGMKQCNKMSVYMEIKYKHDTVFKMYFDSLNYHSYIRSNLWKDRREIYYRLYASKNYEYDKDQPYKCYCHDCLMNNCSDTYEKNKLQLHHNTYKRLGNEDFDDLVLLCEYHHALRHDK
jgi:hypothetical protein